ncbi:MAG: NAD-dependent succinate-semialdehyde dehydrogenase [Pseudomonadales bacterium]|jgi:succinate-semialdehyde dehydrogenase/glutarate-semialdehyde dehydrogenase|nr:NAD-dependent succinate-semialdehyde dehydrogenase [Pseudomonadales bacterium]
MSLSSRLQDPALLRTQAYVDGAWIDARTGGTVAVEDPATGAVLATVPDLGRAETRLAIEAAAAAWPAWRARTAKERGAILRRWFELIMASQEDLAVIMTAEQGKPLAESRGEIAYGASFVEWFAEEGKRIYGDLIPHHAPGRRILVQKQPIGVVGAITPWNFPNAMITRKCAPALAVGCPVVIKPSELTPLSALALAELAERAGVPRGVFNVVTGADAEQIGLELTEHEAVRKIAFTGSTAVGKQLMRQASGTVKKVSLELGGNAPLIVFDDADLDAAVEGALVCKFRNTGQTCVCANRILVQDGIHDAFAERLTEAVAAMKQGNGFEAGVALGPLIMERAVDKVAAHVDDALQHGAELLTGGMRLEDRGRNWYAPTVLAGATPAMRVFREETFGPVAPLFRFETEEEAVHLANDTEYGLAAYFFARDLGRVWRVTEALEYGMVAVNEGVLSTEVAPFGGMKESGLGREGSKYGAEEFLELKYVLLGGIGAD